MNVNDKSKIINDNMDNRIDHLLKKVMPDDLPGSAKNKMEKCFARFQRQLDEKPSPAFLDRCFGSLVYTLKRLRADRTAVSPLLIKKAFITFASFFFVVVGTFMQLSGSRNIMAESAASFSTSVSSVKQIRTVSEIRCSMRVTERQAEFRQYDLRWNAPGILLVHVFKIENDRHILIKKIESKPGGITITDKQTGVARNFKIEEQIKDPDFLRIRFISSPERLVEILGGKWKPLFTIIPQSHESEHYQIYHEKSADRYYIMIDTRCFLPLTLKLFRDDKRATMDIRFTWDEKQTVPMERYWFHDRIGVKLEKPMRRQNENKSAFE